MKRSISKNKLIIIGCGRLGSTIANERSKKGENVIVVDPDEKALLRLSEVFTGITVLGNATDLSKLEEAGINSAYEVVVATGDDNVNIFVAHVCRVIYDVETIVVRLDDPTRGSLIEGMKIKSIYPLELSLNKLNIIDGGN